MVFLHVPSMTKTRRDRTSDRISTSGVTVKIAVSKIIGVVAFGTIHLVRDESGQDLIEYALVAALVGLGAVATIKGLGTKIGAAFTNIGTTLTSNT